jgi:hypothetical protein
MRSAIPSARELARGRGDGGAVVQAKPASIGNGTDMSRRRWTTNDLSVIGAGVRTGSKFGNTIIRADNLVFRSKLEYRRYRELKLMISAGAITDLEIQPRFSLDVAGVHICTYVADYAYKQDNERVVEDCKGMRTLLYRAKKALMLAVHGIRVREIVA